MQDLEGRSDELLGVLLAILRLLNRIGVTDVLVLIPLANRRPREPICPLLCRTCVKPQEKEEATPAFAKKKLCLPARLIRLLERKKKKEAGKEEERKKLERGRGVRHMGGARGGASILKATGHTSLSSKA